MKALVKGTVRYVAVTFEDLTHDECFEKFRALAQNSYGASVSRIESITEDGAKLIIGGKVIVEIESYGVVQLQHPLGFVSMEDDFQVDGAAHVTFEIQGDIR